MKCVTKEECSSGMFNGTWWIFGNECLKSCPAKYEQIDSVKGGCRRCKNDFCPKDCLGLTIETLAHLQQMSGCTTINGSLYIKITKSIPYYELEENLGSIHIITGSLRIQRVKIISSLSFLKNLRYINGTNLIYNKYALFVSENPNLQKLWDYNNIDNFSLKILNGTIGFHYNSQLCLNEILKLVNLTGLTDYNVTDISLTSNGDKSTCNLIDLKVHLTNINSTNVTMTWNEISLEHNESYIGYIIYYTEDASGNATGFDSQDVCETRGWRSVYVSNNTAMLLKLKPFTQYAYYIKMYSSSVSGGQTSIMYFRTLPSDPQEVREAWAIALNDYSIKLEWKPPKIQNGVLSHYKISYYVEKDMVSFYDNRDYCLYPFTEHVKTVNENQISSETQSENKCQCEKDDNVRNEHQFFIDGSHKICYIFDCHEFEYGTESSDSSSSTAMIEVNKRNSVKKAKNKDISVVNNKYTELYTKNPNLTSFIISDLPYFTMHIFFIEACNKDVKECSGKVQAFNRTLKKLNADDIPNDFNVKVDDTSVYIKWSEPKHPNGAILSYNIYQTKLDEQHYKPVIKCITRLQHEKSHYTYTIKNIQPGQYSIRLRAISVAGEGRYTKPLQFTIAAPINHGVWIAIIVIVFLITFGLVAFYFWNRRKRTFQNIQLIASVNPEYVSAVYVDDAWEIQRDDIELHNELGHGMFGKVYSGVIKSRNQLCAVKTVNEGASLNYCVEFLNEALVMQSVSNAHHVVKLLGVVSRGHPPLVAMELMMRGDLKSYLRRCRESSSQNITSNEVYRMAIEIADGMAYLAAKKFVHRDLAARNCMVAHDRTVKIGDFGMTRDIYVTDYYRKETRGLMPVRWMAPESLADGVFTSQSDIWSYGIVLWEISTLAEQPYQGLANEQVLEFVISRGKLKRPPDCTDLTFEIMDECWHWRPNDRPTFGDIVEKLESHVGQDFKIVSYYFNRHGLTVMSI